MLVNDEKPILDDLWALFYDNREVYERLLRIKQELDPHHVFTANLFAVGATSCPRFAAFSDELGDQLHTERAHAHGLGFGRARHQRRQRLLFLLHLAEHRAPAGLVERARARAELLPRDFRHTFDAVPDRGLV